MDFHLDIFIDHLDKPICKGPLWFALQLVVSSWHQV